MRLRSRVDDNHKQVVRLFRQLGWLVADTSRVGIGFGDIVIQRAGVTFICEIKDGKKPPSKRRLTPDQVKFHAIWTVYIIKSIEEVVDFSNSH